MAAGFAVVMLVTIAGESAEARRGDRTLKLYFTHTREKGEFTYKRGGRYDKRVIKQINHFLRDWRRNESTQMDPKVLDLLWEVHRQTRSKEHIHIVSAYRSLKTNNMLRSRSRGVAKKSQHTLGKAIDFYIPGVPVSKIRKIGFKLEAGGVGYYPTSGTPFVHLDTGSVRSWPRMTRKQLIALFPDQKTLHLPSDGKPLAGYERAVAQRKSTSKKVAVAYLDESTRSISSRSISSPRNDDNGNVSGWLKKVFTGGADGEEDRALQAKQPQTEVQVAATTTQTDPEASGITASDQPSPRPKPVSAFDVASAAPQTRPSAEEAATLTRLAYADPSLYDAQPSEPATASDGAFVPIPLPEKSRLLHMAANARALELSARRSAQASAAPSSLPAGATDSVTGGDAIADIAMEQNTLQLAANQEPDQLPVAANELQVDRSPAVIVAQTEDTNDALTALYASATKADPAIDKPQLASLIKSASEAMPLPAPSNQQVALVRSGDDEGKPLIQVQAERPVLAYASAPESQDIFALISNDQSVVGNNPATERLPEQSGQTGERSENGIDLTGRRLSGTGLLLMMSENSTRTSKFGQFTAPQPLAAAGLFVSPISAADVKIENLSLRTDRFTRAGVVSSSTQSGLAPRRLAYRN